MSATAERPATTAEILDKALLSSTGSAQAFATIKGVDPALEPRVTEILPAMEQGSLDALAPSDAPDASDAQMLPGIVLAYMLGLPLIVGAFAAGMLCATATGFLAANSRVKQDTVMGVVFAAKQIFINPESFTFLESIGVLAMVILGGMGSIPGAIIGATVVTVLNLQVLKGLSLWLNELKNAGVTVLGYNLADLPTQLEPAKYERMIFGLILVLMMIFRPQGIFPARRRQRELGK